GSAPGRGHHSLRADASARERDPRDHSHPHDGDLVAVKAVFLDRDGTLLENVPYNVDPERMRLVPGAGAALRRLYALGYALIVVSNQPGVALGYFDVQALRRVERRLRELLAAEQVPLAGFYFCPHHPAGRV